MVQKYRFSVKSFIQLFLLFQLKSYRKYAIMKSITKKLQKAISKDF